MKLTQATAKKVVARVAVCVLVTFLLRYGIPTALKVVGATSGAVLAENVMDVALLFAGVCFGLSIFALVVTELTNKEGERNAKGS